MRAAAFQCDTVAIIRNMKREDNAIQLRGMRGATMNSKQGDSGRIARRVISLGSARLRLLFMPVMIAWALLGVALLGVDSALFSKRRRNRGTKTVVAYSISW